MYNYPCEKLLRKLYKFKLRVTIYIIVENLIAIIIFSNNFKRNIKIWIKILNEKNPLIFFRYTVSPAYEQFIAQNNRLSIKPCLLNICSDINDRSL